MENKHKQKIKLISIVLLGGLPLSTLFAYLLAFTNRVYPKVTLCQTVLTGQNYSEAETILNHQIKDFSGEIKLSVGSENFTIAASSLNINFNNKATLDRLFRLGREKFPLFNLKRLYLLYTKGERVAFEMTLDNKKLDDEIATISAKFFQPAVNPEIKIVKKGGFRTIMVEPGKDGHEVDKRVLKTTILQELACPKKEIHLTIPVNQNSPKISLKMTELTKNRADNLLGKELVLKLDGRVWKISDEEIISFLSFENGFDRRKINDYAKNFAKTINSPPENAALQFENNIVKVFKPSKDGITLQEKELAKSIIETLGNLETMAQNQTLDIPFIETPAQISTADVNNLGIKELLGRGTSLFYGSIPERIHNLQLASLKLNGMLIPPGEIFSFNKSLGNVSADTGFKQAYIIKEGRTVLGDGGGVCQVSTTLFRAVLTAGLPITERHAHAYRVHYYEDDLGPGFDATVFDPTADLKIKNDTPVHILIQSSINLKKKMLTFELYGATDGRKAEISKARVWDKQPPPPDLYQDDPTLPLGTIKQIDWKAWGSKAAFDYKVTKNGETIFEKTFSSVYRPWQAIYLRGTGK